MKVWAWAVVAVLAVPSVGLARGKRGGGGSSSRYDESTDFSKHFDDEVKYDREHPRSDDGAPAPKKRKSQRGKKHSAPPPESHEAEQ